MDLNVDKINNLFNKIMGFAEDPVIKTLAEIILIWYGSRTRIEIPFMNALLENISGKIFLLTLVLWNKNKDVTKSLLSATAMIIGFHLFTKTT